MPLQDEYYMQRCIYLAGLAAGYTAPNPLVGAVLVFADRIIGEGYHKKYGDAHAEVNCIESVAEENLHLIERSTLYVSLEPCAHFGKTPPCSDLIIRKKIPRVVIGCEDPFAKVNGKGIEKLKAAGIEIKVGILEAECKELNRRFFTFHTKQRPYIILKWAQTADKKIALNDNKRLIISNKITNRLVHKWRSEEATILVGTNTATVDNPELTNRLWSGKNPVRLLLDKNLKLATNAKIFNDNAPVIVFNLNKNTLEAGSALENRIYYFMLHSEENIPAQIAACCYKLSLQSILVEGGAQLLQSFINESLYDELRVITNDELKAETGLNAPDSKSGKIYHSEVILSDTVQSWR